MPEDPPEQNEEEHGGDTTTAQLRGTPSGDDPAQQLARFGEQLEGIQTALDRVREGLAATQDGGAVALRRRA